MKQEVASKITAARYDLVIRVHVSYRFTLYL